MHLEPVSERRKMREIDNAPGGNHHPKAKALIFVRCTDFFIGWAKRFGFILTFFSFPLNMEEHPNL